MESRDVLRHSIVDAALQVAVNILVQRHTPWGAIKSRLARAMHEVVKSYFYANPPAGTQIAQLSRQQKMIRKLIKAPVADMEQLDRVWRGHVFSLTGQYSMGN